MWVSIVKDYVVPILSATATAGGIFMALMRKTFVPPVMSPAANGHRKASRSGVMISTKTPRPVRMPTRNTAVSRKNPAVPIFLTHLLKWR